MRKYDVNGELQIIGVIVGDGYLDVITNKAKIRVLDAKEIWIKDIDEIWGKTHKGEQK